MDNFSRFMLLGLVLGFAIWRLVRYLKMGMSKQHPGLVSGAGMLVQSAPEARKDGASQVLAPTHPIRPLGALGGLAVWVLCNVIVLFVLFGLPSLRDWPPLILMVTAVFPNFYLIPFARRLATKWSTPRDR